MEKSQMCYRCVLLSMLFGCQLTAADILSRDSATTEPALQGVQTVKEGFVFVDGTYVEAPYRIERKDCSILVNGQEVYQAKFRDDAVTIVGDEDLPIPSRIRQDTSLFDPLVNEYTGRKARAIHAKYSPEEEEKRMEEMFRALPCVSEARRDTLDKSMLIVRSFKNEEDRVMLPSPRRKAQTKDQATQAAERWRVGMANRLSIEDTYFFCGGGLVSFGEHRGRDILPSLVQILNSDRPEDKKIVDVARILGLKAEERCVTSLVKNYRRSRQLDDRVRAILATTRPS